MAVIAFSNAYWIKIGIAAAVILTVVLEARGGYFSGFKIRPLARSYACARFFYPVLFSAVLLTLIWDLPILRFLQSLTDPATALAAGTGRFLGKRMLIVLIVLYLISATRRLSIHPTIRGMLFGSALAGVVITVFKFTFLRARPYGGFGPYCFFNLPGLARDEHVFQSFPSGDVAVVAGAAGYLFYTLKNKYLRLLCVLAVLSTALSRIQRNSHWPSDTLAAFAIGFVVSYQLVTRERKADRPVGSGSLER